jgi:hypothetical protein
MLNLACSCLLAPLTLVTSAPPQEPTPVELPQADALFERAVEAMGGEEAFRKVKSVYVEVVRHLPESTNTRIEVFFRGAYPFSIKDGAEFFMREKRADGEILSGCDGEVAWRVNTEGDARLLKGRSTLELESNANFHNLTRCMQLRYPRRRTERVVQFDGKECYKVLLEASGHLPEQYVLFDKENGLLAGNQAGVIAVYYRDWKKIKDLRFYTEVTIQSGSEPPVVARIEEIVLDKVKERSFKLPRSVTKLIKAEKK